jgi:hypothetical protein
MFQYTKETILNALPEVVKLSNGAVLIKGVGEYVPANIGKVSVTEGVPGEEATLTIPVSELTGKEVVLSFRVITPNQYLAEFASPNWEVFGKPIIVGMNVATGADALKAIELAIPQDNTFATVELKGSDIVITGKSKYITFDKCYVTTVSADDKVADTEKKINGVKANVEPFATKEWIIENLRFPTYPNIRYASASTMPTADLYTEFSFDYTVVREGLGGLSGVGQGLTATTRHIVYVPATLGADFKAKLTAEGITKFDETDAALKDTVDAE